MHSLIDRDPMALAADRLLAAVEAIYDTAASPSFWPSALGKIADCFDDAGAILQWRRDDGAFGALASESLAPALADYGTRWAQHDFKAERCVSSGLISGTADLSACPGRRNSRCRHTWFIRPTAIRISSRTPLTAYAVSLPPRRAPIQPKQHCII